MTENEQLRKELNELRERVAVLESQRPKPAPAPPGPLAGLGVGILGDAARQRQQQEAERQRDRYLQQNNPLGGDDRLRCEFGNPNRGVVGDMERAKWDRHVDLGELGARRDEQLRCGAANLGAATAMGVYTS